MELHSSLGNILHVICLNHFLQFAFSMYVRHCG